jgi:alpha-mannosidase
VKRLWLMFLLVFLRINLVAQSDEPKEQAINSNVKEIVVIFKTHYDIGYTNPVKDVLQYYRTEMIDKVLDIMDETRDMPAEQQFRWTVSGWVMAKVLEDWEGQTPERSKLLKEAFKSGRIVCHAVPFTVQSEIMFPEDFARFYEPSTFITRKYGLPLPRGAKMTDVPSQGSVLATGLAQAGVEFIHIGCNWPSGEVKYPPLFWWEGPDGSRVLTLYSPFYGTVIIDYSPNSGGRDAWCGRNLIPPPTWPYSIWPAIIVTGDNSGPPDINYIKGIFEEAAKKMPGVKIRVGRLEDFADAILAINPVLPVIKAEAPDTWIHGVMSDPGGMKIFRNINPLISALEVLNTQLGNWNLAVGDITKDISKAYENSVLYSEHIWGYGDNINQYGKLFKSYPAENYRILEQSWEDKTDFIRTTEHIIKPLLSENLTALANNVNIEGKRIIVYNPLPWVRSEWVEVASEHKFFLAKHIPPCGYKAFLWKDLFGGTSEISNSDLSGQTIENKYYKIKIDSTHCIISSLIDKLTGREWADPSAEQGIGQYLNERFTFEQTVKYVTDYQRGRGLNAFGVQGNWLHPGMYKPGMISEKQVPYRAVKSKNGNLKIIRDAGREIAIIDIPGDSAKHFPSSSLCITLQKDKPFIDIELTIRNKDKDNWPEADWLCFPFKVNSPKFTVGRSLGMMDPVKDIMEGSNKDLYAVGTGITITDEDGSGIAFCPFDHPIISLDRPGIWKFTENFIPGKPVIYLNLYNNQWNTTYRYWYSGTWSSKVRIWTFSRDNTTESSLVTPSLEARIPLLVAEADGKAGNLPNEQAGIKVSRKGIQITAFRNNSSDNPVYASNDSSSGSTLLRLWEQGGISDDLTIILPKRFKYTKATAVNLRGQVTGKQIPIMSGRLTFFLHAYSPASYVLE